MSAKPGPRFRKRTPRLNQGKNLTKAATPPAGSAAGDLIPATTVTARPRKAGAADRTRWVAELNALLSQEHACSIRYATHAAVVTGPYREGVAARLMEIAADEIRHAQELRDRIVALDGIPTMDVRREDLTPAASLGEILAINMAEERQAIVHYSRLLETIPRTNAILHKCLESILADEQEHLEQLKDLRPE